MSNWFKTFLAFVSAFVVMNVSGLHCVTRGVGNMVINKIGNKVPCLISICNREIKE